MRTKFKSDMLQKRDANTKAFHRSSTLRRCHNQIITIQSKDGITEEFVMGIKQVLHHFQARWQQPSQQACPWLLELPNTILTGQNELLTKIINEEDIEEAIKDMHLDEAPRIGLLLSF